MKERILIWEIPETVNILPAQPALARDLFLLPSSRCKHLQFMPGEAPKKERILVWQMSPGFKGDMSIENDCFSCTGCSWTFPNPKNLTQEQHDMTAVDSRFTGHVCSRNLPPRKFNW